mgnify:CR=1 FL=1
METEELIVKLLKVIGSEEKLNKDIEICQKEIIMSDTIKTYFRKTADEYQNSGNRHNARYFENAMEHCKLLQEIDKFKLEFYSFKKDLFDILSNYKEN